MAKQAIITGLDIGTSNIRVAVGQVVPGEDKPIIIGVVEAKSAGLRRGNVVDSEEAVSAISEALEKAERLTGMPIENALVSVCGSQITCHESSGTIAVSRADGEISKQDKQRVLEAAQAIAIPPNHEVLHILARDYKVDGESGVKDPVGMSGVRLEVEACVVEVAASFVRNLTRCVYRTGVDIKELVLSPLASAEAVLTKRQKELGVALIDIGAGTTKLAIFEEGSLVYVSALAIAGEHVTNDLAIGLRSSIETAEKVKLEYGSVNPRQFDRKEEIDLSKINRKDKSRVPRFHIAEIIEARAAEIFSLIDAELVKIDRAGKLPAGIVLTGATAKLSGIVDLAKEELKLPAQIGFPEDLRVAVDQVEDPRFSTVVGLVLWGAGPEGLRGSLTGGRFNLPKPVDTVKAISGWLKKRFLP